MTNVSDFKKSINEGYGSVKESLNIGVAMWNGEAQKNLPVRFPLKTMNRHGLVSGATGTGKTKTLQRLCELFSEKAVPVFIMDMKGDVSGLGQPGTKNAHIEERAVKTGFPWKAEAYPVEFLTLSDQPGVRLRASVSEFGPVLFSKILELNDTQASILSLIFKYADDNGLPLLDLKDIKKLIQFLTNEGKNELKEDYGTISTASTGLILRKIVEIEGQGADRFFGEKSFDVEDLLRVNERGYGTVHILRLMDIQDKPKMFSTFMLSLLAEIFQKFPEEGDLDQPKLMIFIDEAHLMFREASKALLSQLEMVIKLIRSKGVGIVFCTQLPTDIPPAILSQLGFKIQHALRAFTAADRKTIKLAAENYPTTRFYKTDELITALGIGESLITALNEKGEPTPLVHTFHSSPQSRMGTITDREMNDIISASTLRSKYSESIDRESAYEMLAEKLSKAAAGQSAAGKTDSPQGGTSVLEEVSSSRFAKSIAKAVLTSFARNVTGQLTRGILGSIMGKTGRTRTSRF